MRRLLILGGGAAGTMAANRLSRRLPHADWQITVVDKDGDHHYQPGYLFVPFGGYDRHDIVRSRRELLPDSVTVVLGDIDQVRPEDKDVVLTDGRVLDYDYLVIATGVTPRPDQTPGMLGAEWRKSIFDFYTLEGAEALHDALLGFEKGRVVVHVTETPIKCPPAPLEFAFLLDSWLTKHHRRQDTTLTFVTPLDGAFTRPIASRHLGAMLEERNIGLETDFVIERIDDEAKKLISYDEREIPFDLLVTVPVNMGADYIARSGLGDDLNCVPVDPKTNLSTAHPEIFALGDAANLPTSKAGSVAHFSVEIFVENFLRYIEGKPMTAAFDGHANCFVEAGDDKAIVLDFNYETEPLPGKFPIPVLGPLSLLEETRVNHLAKLAFRQIYWTALLKGRPLPISTHMSMAGKHVPADLAEGA